MIIVRLNNLETKFSYDLNFELENNPFVDKWLRCLNDVIDKNHNISEPWAIYNLNQDFIGKSVVDKLNHCIDICNKYYPNHFDQYVTDYKDQKNLNYFHHLFFVLHDQNHNTSDEFNTALSTINQLIHYCETMYEPTKKIRVVWFKGDRSKKFTSDDYNLFSQKVEFGGMYHLYSDVGKTLDALALDNDTHINDFVPNLHYSADMIIRLYDRSVYAEDDISQKAKTYFMQNEKEFSTLGYQWGDPLLTHGSIKLAQLKYNSREEVLKNISKCNNIEKVLIV